MAFAKPFNCFYEPTAAVRLHTTPVICMPKPKQTRESTTRMSCRVGTLLEISLESDAYGSRSSFNGLPQTRSQLDKKWRHILWQFLI